MSFAHLVLELGRSVTTHLVRAQKEYELQAANLILQKSVLIMWCISVPLCVFWVCCEPVVVFLGQSEHIAHDARLFLMYLIPGLYFFALKICLQKWLHLYDLSHVSLYACIAASLLHPFTCYLCIYALGMGFSGAAFSHSVTLLMELFFLIAYSTTSNILIKKRLRLSYNALEGWGEIIKEGLHHTAHLTDWWASEAVIFISGLFARPEIELSAMILYRTMIDVCAGFPAGLHDVCFGRVRSFLLLGQTNDAHKASRVGPALGGAVVSILSVFLLLFSPYITAFFIRNSEICHIVNILMLPLCVCAVTDAVQSVLTAVLEATGTLHRATPFVTACYYLIGIPVAVYLSVPGVPVEGKNWGVVGLSWGIASAAVGHLIVCACVAWTIPWDQLEVVEEEGTASSRARKRSPSQSLINFIGEDSNTSLSNSNSNGRSVGILEETSSPEGKGIDGSSNFTSFGNEGIEIPTALCVEEISEGSSFYQQFRRWLSYLPHVRVASSAKYDMVQSYTSELEDVSSHDDDLDDAFTIDL